MPHTAQMGNDYAHSFVLHCGSGIWCLASRSQVWVLAWKGILETWKRRGARLRKIRMEPRQGSAQGLILKSANTLYKEEGRPVPGQASSFEVDRSAF